MKIYKTLRIIMALCMGIVVEQSSAKEVLFHREYVDSEIKIINFTDPSSGKEKLPLSVNIKDKKED